MLPSQLLLLLILLKITVNVNVTDQALAAKVVADPATVTLGRNVKTATITAKK